jgi:LacI family transcriptional regulator/LacI family repressor for deo operon, udp, cdd, tsx, nupC, and nupG
MTLKDIAKAAGVSISTVSRILNGNSVNAASKKVQDKIWEIAREGGYIPNTSAQALKTGISVKKINNSIACIYARSVDAKNDAFFSALTRSIEQEALKEGFIVKYSFSAFDIHNPATQHQIINNEVDGVAVLGRCDKETLKFLKLHFKKVVYAGLNALDAEYDQVICDGYAVAAEAMEYLFQLGHVKIGYIGEMQKEVRYLAYRDSLKNHHITLDKNLITNVPISSDGGYQGAKRILESAKDVTAFFCINDITAIGALKAIQDYNYKIPEDISVISMDDIDISQYVSPMLTTMHIPIEEIGKMTAKILIDRIKNGHTLPLKISLPFYLVKRESCAVRKRI